MTVIHRQTSDFVIAGLDPAIHGPARTVEISETWHRQRPFRSGSETKWTCEDYEGQTFKLGSLKISPHRGGFAHFHVTFFARGFRGGLGSVGSGRGRRGGCSGLPSRPGVINCVPSPIPSGRSIGMKRRSIPSNLIISGSSSSTAKWLPKTPVYWARLAIHRQPQKRIGCLRRGFRPGCSGASSAGAGAAGGLRGRGGVSVPSSAISANLVNRRFSRCR
jgi:hypothetical protein